MNLVREILGRFERGSFAVFGILVGIISVIYMNSYGNLNSDIKQITAIIVGLVITSIFIQLGDLVQKDRISQILGPYYQLRNDRELYVRIQEFLADYDAIKKLDKVVFKQTALASLCTFVDKLSTLAEGRLSIDPREDLLYVITLLNESKSTIKASSFQNLPEYWSSPKGIRYVSAQEDFINNKEGKVTRIFILTDEETEIYKDIMLDQARRGIDVRIAPINDVPLSAREGYVIYDDSSVRTERSTTGFYKDATLIIDENIVRNYLRWFDDLFNGSALIIEIFPEEFQDQVEEIQNETSQSQTTC